MGRDTTPRPAEKVTPRIMNWDQRQLWGCLKLSQVAYTMSQKISSAGKGDTMATMKAPSSTKKEYSQGRPFTTLREMIQLAKNLVTPSLARAYMITWIRMTPQIMGVPRALATTWPMTPMMPRATMPARAAHMVPTVAKP